MVKWMNSSLFLHGESVPFFWWSQEMRSDWGRRGCCIRDWVWWCFDIENNCSRSTEWGLICVWLMRVNFYTHNRDRLLWNLCGVSFQISNFLQHFKCLIRNLKRLNLNTRTKSSRMEENWKWILNLLVQRWSVWLQSHRNDPTRENLSEFKHSQLIENHCDLIERRLQEKWEDDYESQNQQHQFCQNGDLDAVDQVLCYQHADLSFNNNTHLLSIKNWEFCLGLQLSLTAKRMKKSLTSETQGTKS